jgi:hypothetical protein
MNVICQRDPPWQTATLAVEAHVGFLAVVAGNGRSVGEDRLAQNSGHGCGDSCPKKP